MSIENIITAIGLRVKDAVQFIDGVNSDSHTIESFLKESISDNPMLLGTMLVLLNKQPTIFSSFFDEVFNKHFLAETLDCFAALQAKREARQSHDPELFKYHRALGGLENLLTAHVAFNTERPQFMTIFGEARTSFFMGCREAGRLIQAIATAAKISFEDASAWAMHGNDFSLLIEPKMAAVLSGALFLMRSGDEKYINPVYKVIFSPNVFEELALQYSECQANHKAQDLRVEYDDAAINIMFKTDLKDLVSSCYHEKGGSFDSMFCGHEATKLFFGLNE